MSASKNKVASLEKLASAMVGDDGSPNVFFVTVRGSVVLISTYFELAYAAWKAVSSDRDQETTLEDRQTGVLASVERAARGGFVVIDDATRD